MEALTDTLRQQLDASQAQVGAISVDLAHSTSRGTSPTLPLPYDPSRRMRWQRRAREAVYCEVELKSGKRQRSIRQTKEEDDELSCEDEGKRGKRQRPMHHTTGDGTQQGVAGSRQPKSVGSKGVVRDRLCTFGHSFHNNLFLRNRLLDKHISIYPCYIIIL